MRTIDPSVLGGSHKFKFESWMLDIQSSMEFDKEEMLERLVEQSGLSPEMFGVVFVLEEYPIEIVTAGEPMDSNYSIKVVQEFKVRPKTDEEMQLALESYLGETDGKS